MEKLFFVYLLVASIAISASFAEFQINTYTSSYQSNPAVAADANGNFIVVWNSYSQDGSSNGIFARLFSADGTALSNEFQVNTTATGNQTELSVAMDDMGNFVVAWHRPGVNEEDIFAKRFDPNSPSLLVQVE